MFRALVANVFNIDVIEIAKNLSKIDKGSIVY